MRLPGGVALLLVACATPAHSRKAIKPLSTTGQASVSAASSKQGQKGKAKSKAKLKPKATKGASVNQTERYRLYLERQSQANRSIGYTALDEHMHVVVGAAVATRHINRIIVPLFSNLGFMPFLKNLMCSMARPAVQVDNYVVVAMDNVTCGALRATGFAEPPDACVSPYARRPLSADTDGAAYSGYGSLHFWRLVVQRPLWVMWLLEQGYSVLQCDVDIVFLHNPLPLFEQPTLRKYNALFQSEQAYGINCGFYFVRPGNATLEFMRMWLDDMVGPKAHHVVHGGKMHEQHSFVRINSNALHKRGLGYSSRRLNQTLFPNGKIWYQYWHWTNKQVAYILHCNWNKNNKKSRLRRDNLWFLDENDQVCRPGFDPNEEQCQRNCVPVTDGCKVGNRCLYRDCGNHTALVAKVKARNDRRSAAVPDLWHPMAGRLAGCPAASGGGGPMVTLPVPEVA